MTQTTTPPATAAAPAVHTTAFTILGAISFCHLLNDMMQSLLPALYPMLKGSYNLSFGQIGFLTFTFQVTASLLQPIVGAYTDRRSRPYSLAVGMGSTLCGLLLLAFANHFWVLLVAAALIGIVLNLRYHAKLQPLHKGLVILHALFAATGLVFVLLALR